MSPIRIVIPVVALACLAAACSQPSTEAPAAAATVSPVERGQELVAISGCHDCHTPKVNGPNGPEPDMTRALSGHPEDAPIQEAFVPSPGSPWPVATNEHFTAWSGPWGVSFAANLTPDTLTGLRSGVWTRELFIQAMRSGKHMGTARPILPPMPWPTLAQMSDEDLGAIWEYLGTIPPILNHVPVSIEP